MKKYIIIPALILFFCVACSASGTEQETGQLDLYVSAASSLTSVLDELEEVFEQENTNIEVIINYGSSGTLVNQLKQGAPGDVLLLASQEWMERAIEAGLAEYGDVTPLLENRLVLAGNKDSAIRQLEDLLASSVNKIAIGDPDSVPACAYAKQVLEAEGIWQEVKNKAVFAKNARQGAVYIESGDVDAGIVFQSDLKAFPQLESLQVIPRELHELIVYPAAITKQAENSEAAEAFLEFLQTDKAIGIFKEYGFHVSR